VESFRGKTALVTGAGSGLGRALCLAIAREGARVIAVDIDGETARETADSIEGLGMSCTALKADVSSEDDMRSLAGRVLSESGRVDLLVNTAGVGIGGRIESLTLEDWKLAIGVNLWGSVYGIHYFLPRMIEEGEGHIVSVSSVSGLVGLPNTAPYAAAKHALVGLCESLRFDLAKHGIGVTVVCPGGIRTGFFDHMTVRTQGERDEKYVRFVRWIWERFSMSPEKAALKVIGGIKRNKPLLLMGIETYLVYFLKRLFPRLYCGIMEFISKRFL
jgi:NAD(P)-dependent dehydrogenase (short-subunit alcohol dehydrogenase family)